MLGSDLRKGINDFLITTKFHDKNQRSYQVDELLTTNLVNVTLIQNILLTLNNTIGSFQNLGPKSLATVAVTTFLVFLTVIWLIFRKK